MMRKSHSQQNYRAVRLMCLMAFAFVFVLCQSRQARGQTQWTTAPNGNDIYKTNGGNVGIGTSTPVSQLEISSASPLLTLTHGNGAYDNAEFIYRMGNNWKWGMIHYADANANTALQNALVFYQFTDKNNATINLPRMVIDNDGRVGIGTSSPGGIFDVQQPKAGNMLARFLNTNTSGSVSVRASTSSVSTSTLYPAFEFGDSGYWLASLAADRTNGLRFRTGNTSGGESALVDRMTISPTGNVGIGTSTPQFKLDVSGNASFRGGSTYFRQSTGLASGEGTLFATGATANNESYLDMSVYRAGSYVSRFGVDNFGRMYLQPGADNVGIGTTSPAFKLDVNGTINATAIYQNGSPFSSSQWTSGTGNISYNAGNVGIGTANPTAYGTGKLVVQGAGGTSYTGADFVIQNSSSPSKGLRLWYDLTNDVGRITAVNYATQFRNLSLNGEANSGNVGVNTVSPTGKFHVVANTAPSITGTTPTGTLVIDSGSTALTTGVTTTSPYYGWMQMRHSSMTGYTYPLNLQPLGGNVGIGVTSPDYKLDVNGTINATAIYQNGSPFSGSQWATGTGNISYSSGNVGVGTTGPGAKFEVQVANAVGDGIKVTDAGAPGKYLYMGEGSSNSGAFAPYIATVSSAAWGLLLEGGVSSDSTTIPAVSVRGNAAGAALANSPIFTVATTTGSELFRVGATGNVGIGTAAPSTKLHVVGDITVTGNINAKYQDVAEWVPSRQKLAAGTVVVLDTEQSNHVMASTNAYDTRVAGVVSAQPGVLLGEAGENKAMIATTGRVKVKVDATRAPVKVGDLLVTSDKEGVAMKSEPLSLGGTPIHRPGTLIGKALEPLEKGTGEILVLLSLQ